MVSSLADVTSHGYIPVRYTKTYFQASTLKLTLESMQHLGQLPYLTATAQEAGGHVANSCLQPVETKHAY